MKIGILGTGMVGQIIGSTLIQKGYHVKMGSRTKGNEKAVEWASKNGINAFHGTFDEAALFAEELIINATSGSASITVLQSITPKNLATKILIDIANPLDFSNGTPPSLSICNTDSLGEQIQAHFPSLKVVKTLNTMNANIMLNPSKIKGNHSVFISGNDAEAKENVSKFLHSFGWKTENILDLGDISTARGTEMLLPVWLRLWQALGTADFNFNIVRN